METNQTSERFHWIAHSGFMTCYSNNVNTGAKGLRNNQKPRGNINETIDSLN